MKFNRFLLLLLPVPAMFGCIDEINLKAKGDNQRIVVDGLIADSLNIYEVKVNYSSILSTGKDYVHEPVIGATVSVIDGAGNRVVFAETKSGLYTKEMKGEAGQTYFVEVVVPGGKKIRSLPETLLKSPPITDLKSYAFEETELTGSGALTKVRNIELRVSTDITGFDTKPYLRWALTGEYEFKEWHPAAIFPKTCYVKDRIGFNNLRIFDTHDLSGNILADELFFKMTYNYRFSYNYCFHIFQYSMSEAEHLYWQSVADIVSIDGSLFDPPPGTVKGNLYNVNDPDETILGYFSVSGVSYAREFANSTSTGVFAEPKCMIFRPGDRPAECYDCLELSSSTLDEPVYWP